MNEIVRFFEIMEHVIEEHPEIYFKIEKLRHNGWWRIHIFGKNMAAVGGDAELLYTEKKERAEAFTEAIEKIEQMKTNIKNLKEKKK